MFDWFYTLLIGFFQLDLLVPVVGAFAACCTLGLAFWFMTGKR